MSVVTPSRARVTVRLRPPLTDLFPGSPRLLELEASSVRDVIDALDQRFPGMGDRLRDSTPAIRRHINVFIAGERAKLETRLRDGDEIFIITAISGG